MEYERRPCGVPVVSPERHHPAPLHRRVLKEHRGWRRSSAAGALARHQRDTHGTLRSSSQPAGVLSESLSRLGSIPMSHLRDTGETPFHGCPMGPVNLTAPPLVEARRRARRTSRGQPAERDRKRPEPPAACHRSSAVATVGAGASSGRRGHAEESRGRRRGGERAPHAARGRGPACFWGARSVRQRKSRGPCPQKQRLEEFHNGR